MLSFGFRLPGVLRCTPWLILISLVCSGVRAEPAELAGTMPEDYLPGLKVILQGALNQSPSVLLQQIRVAQEEARIYDADHLRYPNVGGDIRYDSNQTEVSGNTGTKSKDSGLFYSLSANQAVFYWGEIKNRGQIARIEVAIARRDYAEAYRTLAVELRRTYLGLIARNAELRQRRFAQSLSEADLASARESAAHGTLSAGDLAGRELLFNEAVLETDRKQADFDAERRRFSRLAGIADLSVDQIPLEIPVPRYDAKTAAEMLSALLRDGAKGTPAAEVADLHIQQADLNYRIAQVRLLPKFNASLGHTRESSTSATPTAVSQTAITRDTLEVRGSWSIFDGFATKGAKLDAQADKRRWQREKQIATDAAMDEAQRLERAVGLDARAMQYAEQRRAGSVSNVEQAKSEAKVGTVSERRISEATNELRGAEASAAYARAAFLSDWSAFVSLVSDDPVLSNLSPRYARTSR
jgi:outer membrane protein TolC